MTSNLIKFFTISCIFILSNCTYFNKNDKKQEGEGQKLIKKKAFNPNIDQKTEEAAGGLFGNIGGKNSNTFEFSTSNVLWRATIQSFENIPLLTVDYSGGVIISDWYSPNLSNESLKLTVNFLSNELKASSVKVTSFKKMCTSENKCKTEKMGDLFNSKVKDAILSTAKELEIKKEIEKN